MPRVWAGHSLGEYAGGVAEAHSDSQGCWLEGSVGKKGMGLVLVYCDRQSATDGQSNGRSPVTEVFIHSPVTRLISNPLPPNHPACFLLRGDGGVIYMLIYGLSCQTTKYL